MKNKTLAFRYLFFAVAISITLTVLAIVAHLWVNQYANPVGHLKNRVFFKKLQSLPVEKRAHWLMQRNSLRSSPLYLVDSTGKFLVGQKQNNFNLKRSLPENQSFIELLFMRSNYLSIPLGGSPQQYLSLDLNSKMAKRFQSRKKKRFLQMFILLLIATLIGTSLTVAYIYISMKNRLITMDKVMSDLRKGRLTSRVRIQNNDEFGQFMDRFNKMASEIEHLVHNLKTMEGARKKLLSELAHDLRTPIASLKSLISNLQEFNSSVDDETRLRMLGFAVTEVDYFAVLVEDLLFLGKVSEPKFKPIDTPLNLSALVKDQTVHFNQRFEELEISFDDKASVSHSFFDAKLIRRMVGNALENACSFAKSKVVLSLSKQSSGIIEITVADDGPGFDTKSLKQFGQRSEGRSRIVNSRLRISSGLGSVIMKSITEAYRGQLIPTNRIAANGAIQGAQVSMTLDDR